MDKQNGMTLIELLITIAVIAVSLALGLPAMSEFIKNNRLTGQTNSLVTAIQVARNEAVKRNTGTTICARNPGTGTCSGGNDWTNGWLVFSDLDQDGDLDGNGSCTTAAEERTKECILRSDNAIIKATATGTDSNILFMPDGRKFNAGGTPLAEATITLKADNCIRKQVRKVTVTAQGRTVTTTEDCP